MSDSPRPKKALPFILLAVTTLILIVGLAMVAFRKNTVQPVVITPSAPISSDEPAVPSVGGAGSPEYNKDLHENNNMLAAQAAVSGRSHISSVVGATQTQAPANRPSYSAPQPQEPKTAQLPRAQTDTAPHAPVRDERAAEAMRRAITDQALRLNEKWLGGQSEQLVVVTKKDGPEERQALNEDASSHKPGQQQQATSHSPDPVRPGALFYAVNDISLNSDNPGPVMATIVVGPLKGAKLLGEFKRSNDTLNLAFSTLAMPAGTTRQVQAFGVDPSTEEHGIRTAVDNHTLERWGGLIAASFLEGMGEARATSGSVTTSTYGGYGGAAVTQSPRYDVADQAWIAAGKVGGRLANKLADKFERPPTVTLKAGQPIGILVISAN